MPSAYPAMVASVLWQPNWPRGVRPAPTTTRPQLSMRSWLHCPTQNCSGTVCRVQHSREMLVRLATDGDAVFSGQGLGLVVASRYRRHPASLGAPKYAVGT